MTTGDTEHPNRSAAVPRQGTLFGAIDLTTYKTIRIALAGDVPLTKLETAIVDTPDFQRLRHIRQLGTTYLVYPTALHTRFDHSLGTLSIAMNMVNAIRQNTHNTEDEKRIDADQELLIRLFALLHDIAHLPFGHTLEDEFCIFPRHDQDDDRYSRFLGESSPIGGILLAELGRDLYNRFMGIYRRKNEKLQDLGQDLFIYELVNNTVCADLLDYLRRDCHFCNIVLDMDYRFLKYLYLLSDRGVRHVVVRLWKEGKPKPRRDILSELVRLLDNRYLLGERVYFHHTKLVTGTMLAAAVERSRAAGELQAADLYTLGDDTLMERLGQSRIEPVRRLVDSLRNRGLWKTVYERDRQTVEAEQGKARDRKVLDTIMERWWRDARGRARDEDNIAAALGTDSGDVLIHCPDSRMAMKLAEMQVFWNGNLRPLKDCTDDAVVGKKLGLILEL